MPEAEVIKHWKMCDVTTILQLHKCHRWKIVEHGADSSQTTCGMYLGAQWLLYPRV